MLNLLKTCLTLSTLTMGYVNANDITITNFTGAYEAPSGAGTATRFTIPISDEFTNNLTIQIEKIAGGYSLRLPDQEREWLDPPSALDDVVIARWNGINLSKTVTQVNLSGTTLQTVGHAQNLNLKNLSLKCALDNSSPDEVNQLIQGCLNKEGSLRLGFLELVKHKSDFLNELMSVVEVLVAGNDFTAQSTTLFENIELDIKGDNFTGQIKTKAGITATVKLNGYIRYEEGSQQVRIRIDRARAGILNVMGILFDELTKLQSDSMVVERPWVTINLATEE